MQAIALSHNDATPLDTSWYKEYRRPIIDILADLSKPIPKKYLDTKSQGGASMTFLPWYNCCKLLDRCAPGWDYSIVSVTSTSDRLFVVARITLKAAEGEFTREATGTEELKREVVDKKTGVIEMKELAYGDPSSNAESMALRRAAAKFGLGLYLYDKD